MSKNIENFPDLQTLQEDLKNIKEIIKKPEVPHTYQEKYETILSSLDGLLEVEEDIEINKIKKHLEEFQEVTKELIELKAIKELSDSSDTIKKYLNTIKKDSIDKDGSRFKRNRKKLALGLSLIGGGIFASKFLKAEHFNKLKVFVIGLRHKIKGGRKSLKSKIKTKLREIFHGKEVIDELENKIEFLKAESIPLRFKILEEKNGHTTVRLKFYDRDNKEIKSIDKTIKGTTGLNFDFLIAPMQIWVRQDDGKIEQIPKASLAFPEKIFTDKFPSKHNNLDIRKEYNKDGFPEIFNDSELSDESKEVLKQNYTAALSRNNEKPEGRIGMSISMPKTNPFKVGTVYKIVSHSKGGLEVMED